MKKHYSLKTAEIVLKILEGMTEGYIWDDSISIQSFDNCREQGYVLVLENTIKNIYIAICQHRSSDEIRIWIYNKLAANSNLMKEDSVIEDITFDYNKHYKAAEYIFEKCKYYFTMKK